MVKIHSDKHFSKTIESSKSTIIEIENAVMLPIAGEVGYLTSDLISVGADLGSVIGISSDENDGGFYCRPSVSYNISE